MRDECIFESEEDCPKKGIRLSCDECVKNKHYETIEKAVNDFVSLGDSFTALFVMCNGIMRNDGSVAELTVPVDDINIIHRTMTSVLTARGKEELTKEEIVYRRLIFYFFSLIIDEFNEEEYTEDRQVH